MPDQSENIITVFSDASWRAGHAGIAWWAAGPGQSKQSGSQSLGFRVAHNCEAETIALATGIITALDVLMHYHGVIVVAQSDSLQTLSLFLGAGGKLARKSDVATQPKLSGTPTEDAYVKQSMKRISESGGQLWLKHVRGHNGGMSHRSWVNTWCDRHAGLARRAIDSGKGDYRGKSDKT